MQTAIITRTQKSTHSPRHEAERELADAQAKTTAAAAVAQELSSKLEAEESFRSQVAERFDAAAMENREGDALSFQAEISRSAIRLRGLEIRLRLATTEFQECRATEAQLGETLAQLQYQEAIEAERVELQQMITAASAAYDGLVAAAGQFESAIVALKTKAWLDEGDKHRAAEASFSLASRARGFNY
jgi:hypothetical protein